MAQVLRSLVFSSRFESCELFYSSRSVHFPAFRITCGSYLRLCLKDRPDSVRSVFLSRPFFLSSFFLVSPSQQHWYHSTSSCTIELYGFCSYPLGLHTTISLPTELISMCAKDEEPIPLSHWLLVGGRGPAPTRDTFLRMASERKAVYREQGLRKAARKEAYSRAAEAYAEATKQHGTPGLMGYLKRNLGLEKRRERPKRLELVKFREEKKPPRKARGNTGSDSAVNEGPWSPPGDKTPEDSAGGNSDGDVGGAGISGDTAPDDPASGSDHNSIGVEQGSIYSTEDPKISGRSTEPPT